MKSTPALWSRFFSPCISALNEHRMMIFGLMMCFSKKNQNSKENETKSAFPADFGQFYNLGRFREF